MFTMGLQQKQATCHRQKSLKREVDALSQCLPIKTMLLFIDYVWVGSLDKTALFSLINQVKMMWARSSATDFQGRRRKSFPIQRGGKPWKSAFEKALMLMLESISISCGHLIWQYLHNPKHQFCATHSLCITHAIPRKNKKEATKIQTEIYLPYNRPNK